MREKYFPPYQWIKFSINISRMKKIIPPLFIILTCFTLNASRMVTNHIRIDITLDTNIQAIVSEKYLSLAIDTAQVVGGEWWNGDNESDEFDFSRPLLRDLTRPFAPGYLRIGGTEADSLYYSLTPPYLSEPPRGFRSVMRPEHWFAVEDFVMDTGMELFFTLNAGPGNRKRRFGMFRTRYSTDQVESLFQFVSEHAQTSPHFEFGNEINGFWAIYGPLERVDSKTYAKDFDRVKDILRKYPLNHDLAGPAFAFWPVIGQPFSTITNHMRDVLKNTNQIDQLTWHYYPTQSRRCPVQVRRGTLSRFLDVKTFDEVKKHAADVKRWRDKHSPHSEIWMGETGPAQCGGVAGLSDRFANSFWWMDQLGVLAFYDNKIVIRQTLAGSDYGMLNPETLETYPDYWSSRLWRQLMGTRVLDSRASLVAEKNVRTYAHCSAQSEGGVSLLAMNLSADIEYSLNLPILLQGQDVEVFTLSSPDLLSQEVYLNGEKILDTEENILGPLQGRTSHSEDEVFVLSPLTINFYHFPDIQLASCL